MAYMLGGLAIWASVLYVDSKWDEYVTHPWKSYRDRRDREAELVQENKRKEVTKERIRLQRERGDLLCGELNIIRKKKPALESDDSVDIQCRSWMF